MLESELRLEVIATFSALNEALSQLSHAIQNESHLVAWAQDTDILNVREKISAVLNQLYYIDNQDPREIIVCPGFVGASPLTIKLAVAVNECKESFKKSVLSLKTAKISMKKTETLNAVGLSRLHLKQCYRKIPILSHFPHKISWI